MICLDDLQWASAALSTMIAELDTATTGKLVLAPLDAASVVELISDQLHSVADNGVVAVAAAADGVPFLLVEIVRGLLERDLVDASGSVAVVSGCVKHIRTKVAANVIVITV